MNHKNLLYITLLSVNCSVLASNGIEKPQQSEQWVFKNGMQTSSSNVPDYACYRIPAIIKLNTRELLAFAEGREESCSDHDKNIDIVMRKRDLSGHWGPVRIVANHAGRVTRNPAPVVDEKGRINLLYNVNYNAQNPENDNAISESSINQNNNRYRASVYYLRSSDGGESWNDYASQPTNLDSVVHPYAGHESYKNGLWGWYAMTPGHALRLNNGKLFFAANHTEYKYGLPDGEYRYYSHAITFDPTNDSFTLSATVGPDTNEVMAEQLDNGWIYMNMRNNHRSIGKYRAVTYSNDEGSNWMGSEYNHIPQQGSSNYWRDIGYDPALISPQVQSSIIRYSSDKGETGVSRLLFSNPADPSQRKNGTIRISYDEGKTWSDSYRYNSSKSQYSDLVITNAHRVGILYEEGRLKHEGIYYIETNLEKITDSKDSFIPAVVSNNYHKTKSPARGPISTPHQRALDPGTGDLSVNVTFSLLDNANTQTKQFLVRKGNLSDTQAGWGVFIEAGKINFTASQAGQQYQVQADIPEHFIGRKHSLTAIFDRSPQIVDKQMELYLDGKQLITTILYEPLSTSVDLASDFPVIIAGSDHQSILNGLVYGYQIYAYGLDAQTVHRYARSYLKDYNFSVFFNNPENNNFEDFFKKTKS